MEFEKANRLKTIRFYQFSPACFGGRRIFRFRSDSDQFHLNLSQFRLNLNQFRSERRNPSVMERKTLIFQRTGDRFFNWGRALRNARQHDQKLLQYFKRESEIAVCVGIRVTVFRIIVFGVIVRVIFGVIVEIGAAVKISEACFFRQGSG